MKSHRLLGLVLPALGGVAVGAASMNVMEMRTRPMYRASIRAMVRHDQEALAVAAEREGAHLRAAAHRWAAFDACSPEATPVLSAESHPTDSDFWLTPRLLTLTKNLDQDKNYPTVRREEQGILCGKVAIALDLAGEASLAAEVWEQTRKILDLATVDLAKESVRAFMVAEAR